MSQTSEKIDLSAWFRKKEAAERIACSEKHVEKLAREGSLEMQMYKRPEGGPRVAVYHPRDVESISAQRNPNGHLIPAGTRMTSDGAIVSTVDSHPIRNVYDLLPSIRNSIEQSAAILRTVGRRSESADTADSDGNLPPSELQFVGYLSICEAMKFTGLPEKTIQKYAREGRIGKIGTKYRRKDLEGL